MVPGPDGSALGEYFLFNDLTARTGILVQRYLPFVSIGRGSAPAAPARLSAPPGSGSGTKLSFNLQSAFFNVNDQLNDREKPETQMGPARIRLVTSDAG